VGACAPCTSSREGVHHITIVGADRQTSIDLWEGVLGMPFVFEQPNLDNAAESHLYFDPGDGRLVAIFTNEERTVDLSRTPTDPGCVHHIAFAICMRHSPRRSSDSSSAR
jgi:catechol 2,3-dioxygenase-like lactoylglutathione lyase family enzyme